MLASLNGRVSWSSHGKRLAISIVLSVAVHIGTLSIPMFAFNPSSFTSSRLIVVSLPTKAKLDLHPQMKDPKDSAPLANSGTPIPRQRIVELSAAPEINRLSGSAKPIYFPASELTLRPKVLADWDELGWKLPPQAHGMVRVTVYISSSGKVDILEFENSISSEIQEWVRDVLLTGTPFSPGERHGVPVPTRITFEFDLTPLRN